MELGIRLAKDLDNAILHGIQPVYQTQKDGWDFIISVPDRLLYGCDKCGYESEDYNNGQCPRCGEHHGEYHELD